MAKKQSSKSQQREIRPEPTESIDEPMQEVPSTPILDRPYIPYLIIFFFSTAIYFNTLWNQYTLDDTLVLRANKFTLKGFAGIKDLMTHDAFVGFWGEQGGELVSGGRYRPLSMVTLAIEVQLFGMNPAISHAINVLLFALTCLLLFQILNLLLPRRKDTPFYLSVPFMAAMLFAGHPIHTEVVANIKGRDEIMGLLFSLLALYAAVKYVKTQNIAHLVWGAAVFFAALLSKENVITFMAIIPLSFFFFTRANFKSYVLTIGVYIVPILIFLYLRNIYTKSAITSESTEILNNPFAYLPKNSDGLLQHYATVIMIFILYFKLLIFPHPLTHDYNYNVIPIVGVGDPVFLLSVVVNIALVIYALRGLWKKTLPSYAILFYYITFSIVSNLFFTIGTLMNERFVYMSSIGFCLLVSYLIVKIKERFKLPAGAIWGTMIVILLLYTIKTVTRNPIWSDNLTLFLVDCKTSSEGAKVQLAAGVELEDLADRNFIPLRKNGYLRKIGALLNEKLDLATLPDTSLRKEFLIRGMDFVKRSLEIYPTRYGAWLVMGNMSYKLNHDVKEAKAYYDKAIAYSFDVDYESHFDLATVEIDNNMPMEAKINLQKAIALKPEEFSCRFYLGMAYSAINMPDSAIYWFKQGLEINPKDAPTYYKIGTVYGKQMGDLDSAIKYFRKAIECNPDIPVYYEDLGVAYGFKNMPDESIKVSEECLKKFPTYIPALRNIAISYNKKGETAKGHEYDLKIAQISGQAAAPK